MILLYIFVMVFIAGESLPRDRWTKADLSQLAKCTRVDAPYAPPVVDEDTAARRRRQSANRKAMFRAQTRESTATAHQVARESTVAESMGITEEAERTVPHAQRVGVEDTAARK